MSRTSRLMQAFRSELVRRTKTITRGALLTSLDIGPVKDGQFIVTANWSTGTLSVPYTYETVFRHSGVRTPVPRKSACQVSREFVRRVLEQRGVR